MVRRTPLHVNVSTPDGTVPAGRGMGAWLSAIAPSRARGEVTVALISDRRMRVLNRTFRGKDYATDVLSFPVGAGRAQARQEGLGDIVIATGVAARQAREHGHALRSELRLLALHGLLHLLGYDHDHPEDEGRMSRAESRLRKKAGLPAGVIARAAPATGSRKTGDRRPARASRRRS
jgi:probable rRNA maturation factor